jgi:hypothetical protein
MELQEVLVSDSILGKCRLLIETNGSSAVGTKIFLQYPDGAKEIIGGISEAKFNASIRGNMPVNWAFHFANDEYKQRFLNKLTGVIYERA